MIRPIALIMAGGGGTRLWPASVPGRPKQLLDLGIGDAANLLAATVQRMSGLVANERVFVVTGSDQVPGVLTAVPSVSTDRIIVEPMGRNTAPCVALSVLHLRQRLGPEADDAVLIVVPADHHVADPAGFRILLRAACAHAKAHDVIVTLGIEPDRPATGFGYIERETDPVAPDAEAAADEVPIFAAKRFVEKPGIDDARRYVATGRFLWNAGIFVMPLSRIARELERHCEPLWSALLPVQAALTSGKAEEVGTTTEAAYRGIAPAPIDTAVMEKVDDLRVIPARVGWTDLGSWRAVFELGAKDGAGNVPLLGPAAKAALLHSRRCLVWSDDAEIAVIGLQDVAVVASEGRVLVCPLDRAQEVREAAQRLRDPR